MFIKKFLGLNYHILMNRMESLSVSRLSLHLISVYAAPYLFSDSSLFVVARSTDTDVVSHMAKRSA
jgi:hypothetical protein